MKRRSLLVLLTSLAFQISLAFGQTQSPTPASALQMAASAGSPSPAAATASTADHNLREGLKGMSEDSRNLAGWALAIIAGSILAIASTSYLRPGSRHMRKIYLLFIPGWILISLTLYNGDQLSRGYTATMFAQTHERLLAIGGNMNSQFADQLTYFNLALIPFALWLLLFVLWWVFVDPQDPTSKSTSGGNP